MKFHQLIEFGPLISGYAMGILFWNISPVPQGIGVVEGVMALVYTSLGIQGFIAALIVLAFRSLNFWLPMLLGFILLRKVNILKPMQGA
ncbi:MAG: lysylphosphatidylglycerol synthase domain-containing protein [Methanothrix sp.]